MPIPASERLQFARLGITREGKKKVVAFITLAVSGNEWPTGNLQADLV